MIIRKLYQQKTVNISNADRVLVHSVINAFIGTHFLMVAFAMLDHRHVKDASKLILMGKNWASIRYVVNKNFLLLVFINGTWFYGWFDVFLFLLTCPNNNNNIIFCFVSIYDFLFVCVFIWFFLVLLLALRFFWWFYVFEYYYFEHAYFFDYVYVYWCR